MCSVRLLTSVFSLTLAWHAVSAQAPSTAGYLTTDDSSRIYFEECGSGGPAIVLVHDGLTGAAGWDSIWPGLCATFHVVRYDRRGMGRSDAPRAPFSSTADLAALLANRRIAGATIVGASGGGGLALDFALEFPASVQRLVLLGAVVNGLGYSDHFLQRERANAAPLARGAVDSAIAKQVADRFVLAPLPLPLAGHDSARHRLSDILLASPQNLTKRGDLELPATVPAVARLGEVHAPTLILVGEFDIPDVQAHAGAIELGIWGARREVVRDAGHLIQLDQPAVLMERVVAFIGESPLATVPPARLRALAGPYTSPFARGQTGKFYLQDGRLMARFPGGRDIPLYPASDSTFYTLARTRSQVTFRRDGKGRIAAADIAVGGRLFTAVPLRP
jgi:3-oxoadipate enol-lactonase